MFKKIILTSLIFLCSQLFCFAGTYPKGLLDRYGEDFLDYYFSLPESQRTIDEINSFGNYNYNINSCFNAVYKPDTVITPFRPKWQQAEADYYDTLPTE